MYSGKAKNIILAIFCIITILLIVVALDGDALKHAALSEKRTQMIFSAAEGEITSVDIKNSTGKFSIERCEDKIERADGKEVVEVVYRVYAKPELKLSQSKVKNLLNDFYEFHVLDTVSETSNEADLKKFGFLDEEIFININIKDQEVHKFILGGISPDEKTRYVKKAGDDKIYSMVRSKENSFLNDLKYYREKRVGTLDGYTLLSFSVTDKGVRKMGIRYRNVEETEVVITDTNTYVMVLPYNGPVNIDRFGELMYNFNEVYAEDFIEDNASDLSKYGLDEYSALKVVIQDTGKNRHDLTFGKTDEKGNIYTIYGENRRVFTTKPRMYNAVKDINPLEFIDKYTNIFNMKDVRNVTVTGTEKIFSLDIDSHSAEKYKINGKEALDRAFKSIYQGIISIKITGMAEEEKKVKELLDITFNLRNGSKKTAKFYEYDSRNYGVVTTDGDYGLVKKSTIDNLLEILKMFDEKPHLEP